MFLKLQLLPAEGKIPVWCLGKKQGTARWNLKNRARSVRQRDCTGGCDCQRLTRVFELGKKKGTKWGGSRFERPNK